MQTSTITRRTGLRAALIATTALAMASLAATPGAAQDAAPIKIRIQTVGANAATIPDLYARAYGLYKKAGLDAEFLPPIYNAGGAMQMVVQGAADVTYSGGSSVVQVAQQGRKVKVVGVVLQGLDLKVSLTRPGMDKAARVNVTPASPIAERVNALKGMRIGAPATGSSSDLVFRYSLKKYGLEPSRDVTVQPMSDIASMVAASRQGAVDGVAGAAATANARVEAEGIATRFIAFEEFDELLRLYPTYALTTSDDFLAKNPEAIRRLLTVFAEAKKAIRRGLTAEEIATVKKQFFPDMADSALAYALDIAIPALKGPLEPKSIHLESLLKTNNAVADVPATLTFEQVFAPALAAEADKK